MVVTGISEFTYGFGYLYEQTFREWGNLQAAPVLPSLQQEANAAWDAKLPLRGADYYYQFKLSDYLSRTNAKYIADGIYDASYYRISLHRRDNNRQHNRLWKLAQTNPDTYYVAPEFTGLADFNSSFLARQITEKSRLIPIKDCKEFIDGKQHYITFQSGNQSWRDHSEPTLHDRSFAGSEIEKMYHQSRDRWHEITQNFAEDLFEKNVETIRRQIHDERADSSILNLLNVAQVAPTRNEYLHRTADLLSIFYGVTLVLVGER